MFQQKHIFFKFNFRLSFFLADTVPFLQLITYLSAAKPTGLFFFLALSTHKVPHFFFALTSVNLAQESRRQCSKEDPCSGNAEQVSVV